MKSKLYNLKSWLTLEEAALHLASVITEEVSQSDILQLGLEGHLRLSVNLVNYAYVRKGEVKDIMETPVMLFKPDGIFPVLKKEEDVVPGSLEDECRKLSRKPYGEILKQCSDEMTSALSEKRILTGPLGDHVRGQDYVRFEGDVFNAEGIWDLPLLAGERIDVEECYQQLASGPDVELTNMNGTWLKKENGFLYCVYERFGHDYITEMLERKGSKNNEFRFGNPEHFYPAGRLPEGVSIVVRRENLDDFIVGLKDASTSDRSDEVDDLRALEALGLLAEALSLRHPNLYAKAGKRPKKSGIYDIMLGVIEEYETPSNAEAEPIKIHGFKKSTLDTILGDAIEAWERRKQKAL